MYKLGVAEKDWQDSGDVEHIYKRIYEVKGSGSNTKIYAGLPHGNPIIFEAMTLKMRPPYTLLYVLHTTRGEGRIGRYQSPEISENEFQAFMDTFSDYLRTDARFDIWTRSVTDNSLLVWDRHNCLHGYGATEDFKLVLNEMNFVEGKVESLGDHVHHYRPENDDMAEQLLTALDWFRTDLRPEDEQ